MKKINRVYFRFFADLNFFLPPERREIAFAREVLGRASIKDTIEALGVPHTEVALILANGEPVDFSYIVQDEDEFSVYPASAAGEAVQYPDRFVLDVHLGKLANHLRMLGFDTLYRNHCDDEELAEISSRENRILLSRDIGLLKRSVVTYGYYVRNTNPQRQLVEVLQRFDLFGKIAPLCRCMNCNVLLQPIAKEAAIDRVPLKARERYTEFSECPSCSQIFWKGTHYERMQEFIALVLQEDAAKEAANKEEGD